MIWGEIEHEIHNININVVAAAATALRILPKYNERSMIWLKQINQTITFHLFKREKIKKRNNT